MVPRSLGPEAGDAALGLAFLSQSGCHSLLKLLQTHTARTIWRASREELLKWEVAGAVVDRFEEQRRLFRPSEVRAQLARSGLEFIPFGSEDYPGEFVCLQFPPAGLFARGDRGALQRLRDVSRVTIVGTRKATPYGLRAAEAFAETFAHAGIAVISGMALGIDGRAHRAAIRAGGLTVAILGCGADVPYPRRHRDLYLAIAEKGLVLSELIPGAAPARWTFPQRNRLLAALGDASLVIEGSLTSGAMQTAGLTLELGRPVFAVPGPIGVESHRGCNRLLYDGAGPALDPCVTVEDFLLQTRIERRGRGEADGRGTVYPPGGTSLLRPSRQGREAPSLRTPDIGKMLGLEGTSPGADSIFQLLRRKPCSVDQLVGHAGLPAREIMAVLAELEVLGLVRRAGPGFYEGAS
jgi:DNA processing protein